jgi:serine/threonine protein kinase
VSQLALAPSSAVYSALHCVNPDCISPYPQTWGNKFCQCCGSSVILNDRYLPLQRLGSGGFAVTYAVYDLKQQQERVLKVLNVTQPKAIALFEQEARVLANLSHPGIPQVEPNSHFALAVQYPVERSLPCLVMEKINGKTLQEILHQHPKGCPEAMAVNWFHQAVDILRRLHQQQIIHRDLKPDNFMLRGDTGQLVVIDFGGAKVESRHRSSSPSSTRLVSPGYSPPEQATGSAVQPASDFYALGRTWIHLLTGRYPAELEDPTTGELVWRPHARVSVAFADLLDELVRFDVRQRPANAEVIQARLYEIAPLPALRRSSSRRPVQTAGAVINWQRHHFGSRPTGFSGKRRSTSTINLSVVLWDTAWSMVLAAIGGGIGTIVGFDLAYRSPSLYFSVWLWEHSQSLSFSTLIPMHLGCELIVFGAAGLGTALGLTFAGGFGQRRRPLQAGLMGLLGYVSGLLGLRVAALDGVLVGLIVFAELAPVALVLGLGLPAPRLLYAAVAGIAVTGVLVNLAAANLGFMVEFWQFLYPQTPTIGADEASWWGCLIVFSLLGGLLGGCLGLSRYVLVPIFQWLRRDHVVSR